MLLNKLIKDFSTKKDQILGIAVNLKCGGIFFAIKQDQWKNLLTMQ